CVMWLTFLCFSKQMNPFIEDVLNRIQDLLELSPP
ncbi:hypothetical protein E2320_003747, partial [Naja naja]